jgi:F-type H+-transporting ATPase subunit gamma
MEGFLKGQYDRVELVYNQFKNAAMQILTTEQLLPVPKSEASKAKPPQRLIISWSHRKRR